MLQILTNKWLAGGAIILCLIVTGWFLLKAHDDKVRLEATLQQHNDLLTKELEEKEKFRQLNEEILENQKVIIKSFQDNLLVIQEFGDKVNEQIDQSPDKDNQSSDVLKNTVKALSERVGQK
ncbi:hypothetical protein phiOC_p409 [Ochrobactrum phage vB_OspM_OC]|nr:hypothetical protein phiOC_p409 [Ochrobactrum phage vB_OspM_OC]